MKKAIQNGTRKRENGKRAPNEKAMGSEAKTGKIDEQMVKHVQMMTSMIEGRKVSREEVIEMLERKWRQHSLDCSRRIDYVVEKLKKDPP